MKKTLLLLLFISISSLYGGMTVRYINKYGRKYVYLKDVTRYYGMNLKINKKDCKMTSKYSKLEFTYSKRAFYANSVKMHLLFAPFLQKGEAFVSEIDFLRLIDPVLRYKSLVKHKLKTIVIDAGHGGKYPGAVGTKYKEKTLTLQMARYLEAILKARGYTVYMTRKTDKHLSSKTLKGDLGMRAKFATSKKADLFVSIHCNSASSSVSGFETYCLTPAKAPSTIEAKPKNKIEKGNKNDKNSLRLAYEVQKALKNNTKSKDRGVKHARFFVLKNNTVPAILVEAGFLTNPAEQKLLGSKGYQYMIAKSIAEGISRYHRELIR